MKRTLTASVAIGAVALLVPSLASGTSVKDCPGLDRTLTSAVDVPFEGPADVAWAYRTEPSGAWSTLYQGYLPSGTTTFPGPSSAVEIVLIVERFGDPTRAYCRTTPDAPKVGIPPQPSTPAKPRTGVRRQRGLVVVSIAKSAPSSVMERAGFAYVIRVRNKSAFRSGRIIVRDRLPYAVVLRAHPAPGIGSARLLNGVVRWSIPSLGARRSAVLRLSVAALRPGRVCNSAAVLAPGRPWMTSTVCTGVVPRPSAGPELPPVTG